MGFGYIFGLSNNAIDEGPTTQSKSGALILSNDQQLNGTTAVVALNIINSSWSGLRLGQNKIQAVGVNGNGNAALQLNPYGGQIQCGADVTATSFISTSSREKKTDILPFNESALGLINRTDIVSFKYKTDPIKRTYIGFIAEDTPVPLATEDHKEMSINSCIGLLLKAVQELDKKIEGVTHA